MLANPELTCCDTFPGDLAGSLADAAARAPIYHTPAYKTLSNGAEFDLTRFQRLPFIDKQDLRKGFPYNWLAQGSDLERLVERGEVELEYTSGTSEERTPLLLKASWWAEQERRALQLNPVASRLLDSEPDLRRVTIVSPMCSNDIRYSGVPTQCDRIVGNALFVALSRLPFLWGPRDLERMVRETEEWEPLFLDVDPVYGVVFALYCERHNIRLPSLRFILASYEDPSMAHRRILERVFKVPVIDLYGSTETGHLLVDTLDNEGMVASEETACLEVHKPNSRGIGELIVTGLTNTYMPLVRYRIGDFVHRKTHLGQCRYLVHGRAVDAFKTRAGACVTVKDIDDCFESAEGIAHYQLVEQVPGGFKLAFIPDSTPPTNSSLSEVAHALRDKLEAAATPEIVSTDVLMPGGSGKFRLCYPQCSTQD